MLKSSSYRVAIQSTSGDMRRITRKEWDAFLNKEAILTGDYKDCVKAISCICILKNRVPVYAIAFQALSYKIGENGKWLGYDFKTQDFSSTEKWSPSENEWISFLNQVGLNKSFSPKELKGSGERLYKEFV